MTSLTAEHVAGRFPTATEQETLECLLGGPDRFDRLEAGFDAFLQREDKLRPFLETQDDVAAPAFLHLVKLYLRHHREEREAIFDGTPLYASHCLAKATLASALSWRKGLEAAPARPNSFARYYHAVVAYKPQTTQGNVYLINGSSVHRSYTLLTGKEIVNRLHFIDIIPVRVLRKLSNKLF